MNGCHADLLLLCDIHHDTMAAVEQHLHVLCSLVSHRLCQLPATRSVLRMKHGKQTDKQACAQRMLPVRAHKLELTSMPSRRQNEAQPL